jgi:hypothetical protein
MGGKEFQVGGDMSYLLVLRQSVKCDPVTACIHLAWWGVVE